MTLIRISSIIWLPLIISALVGRIWVLGIHDDPVAFDATLHSTEVTTNESRERHLNETRYAQYDLVFRTRRSLGILRKYIKGILPDRDLTIRWPPALSIFKPDRSSRPDEYVGHETSPYAHGHSNSIVRTTTRVPHNVLGPNYGTTEFPYRPVESIYRSTTRSPYDNGGRGSNPVYWPTSSTRSPYSSTYYSSTTRRSYGDSSARYTTPRSAVRTTSRTKTTPSRSQSGGTRKPTANLEEGPYCGVRGDDIKDRIIGGRDADEQEFPWQVALKDNTQGVFCGGAIISKRWIITAAHCVVKLKDISSIRGLIGSNNLRNRDNIKEIQFNRLISHRSYRSDTYENDIALLQTKSELPLYPKTSHINTICLPLSKDQHFNGLGTIAGWGRTAEGGEETETLMAADVELYSDSQCKDFYQDLFKAGKQICAGREEGGRDSCQGDSGGPLIKEEGTKAYLIGIVSFGRGCGRRRSPGVYTKVSHYVHWIRAQI